MIRHRTARGQFLVVAMVLCLAAAGCTSDDNPKEPRVTTTNNESAKKVWAELNARTEAMQAVVGGEWLASDTAARVCSADGVQWVISRFGPPTSSAERDRVLTDLTSQLDAAGWTPHRSATTGDHPGAQLRYPASSSLADGFFVRFRTNSNGSTLQVQTPCTSGDADQLNREKYAEKHTNTPPNLRGVLPLPGSATL